MKIGLRIFSIILLTIFFLSCVEHKNNSISKTNTDYVIFPEMEIKYAKGFAIGIDSTTGYRTLKLGLNSPQYFILQPCNSAPYAGNIETISVPVQRLVIFSTTYIHMLECLDAMGQIVGVEDKKYIYNATLQSQIQHGITSELGELSVLNIEKTLTITPEMMVYIGYTNTLPASLVKIQEFGIPCLPNFDWQEEHPLARAEWIKFFGMLTGKEKLADSLFSEVEKQYQYYQKEAKQFNTLPSALFSTLYNGTWYMPGGKSYIATLLKDAGGTYPWYTNAEYGSLPLNFEAVVSKALQTDIWLNPDANSIKELLERDSRYAPFLSANPQHLGVYQYDKRKHLQGGNDYYEKGAFRVDLVLRDMIILLHPNWLSQDSLYFYRKLQ
jgi:iron complex transport system substrate-binding protein